MPVYDYICDDCLEFAKVKLDTDELTPDQESVFMFETRYSLSYSTEEEVKAATECPFCDGHNTRKLISPGARIRVRGHDWSKFRKENAVALRRDMALHQLQNDDPYSHMRQPGEVSDLEHRLQTGGHRDKNTDKKTFVMGGSNDTSGDGDN